MWGNNRYGDCVTAEEALAKIAAYPHVWVSEAGGDPLGRPSTAS
jgi:hypothetical protein